MIHIGDTFPPLPEILVEARSVRMADRIGTLRPGAWGDVTLLKLQEGPVSLADAGEAARETVTAEQALIPAGVVRNGKIILTKQAFCR